MNKTVFDSAKKSNLIRDWENHIHIFIFLPFYPDQQTDGLNIYEINAHMLRECTQKSQTSILIMGR